MSVETTASMARVNGQPLHRAGEALTAAELRQRACTELLRQAAQAAGLLAADDPGSEDGVPSQAASDAIEALLARELRVPEPDDEACRRHHAANAARYRRDERVRLRHILFAVTPGVDLAALRARAEQALLELRCDAGGALFTKRAGELSNCPSGADGGALGWLTSRDCAPEFAREVFGRSEVGVLPRLVHSRFGLHVVEVLAREGGQPLPFEEVQAAVRSALQQQSWALALRQYLRVLASDARLEGVALEGSDSPLVQ
ncbi:MAG: peptidylprolyl isomerase [Burkholderiales bacterium]|nr:peptidylprolyl isomerase [Burkholderiales bacterium]